MSADLVARGRRQGTTTTTTTTPTTTTTTTVYQCPCLCRLLLLPLHNDTMPACKERLQMPFRREVRSIKFVYLWNTSVVFARCLLSHIFGCGISYEGAWARGNCPQTAFLSQQIYLTNFCWLHLRLMYPRMSQVGIQTKNFCLLRSLHSALFCTRILNCYPHKILAAPVNPISVVWHVVWRWCMWHAVYVSFCMCLQ